MRATLTSLALLLLAAPALAHELETNRRAQATVNLEQGSVEQGDRVRLDVLFWLKIPSGARAERLMLRFDLDRDKQLDPPEGVLLGDEVGAEAIGGFAVQVDGRGVAPVEAKTSARREGQGILVAVLVTWRLPALPGAPGAAATLQLQERALPGAKTPPLPLEVAVSSPLKTDSPTAKVLKPGGDALVLRLTR